MVVSGLHGRNSIGRGLQPAAGSQTVVLMLLLLLRRMLVLLLMLLAHHVLLLDKMLLLHGLRGLLVLLGAAGPAADTRRVGG